MDKPATLAARRRAAFFASRPFARIGVCRSASRVALHLAFGSVLALICSASGRAEALFDASAGARYESNLTRAQQRPDIRGDAAATLSASAASYWALTGADRVSLEVNAATEKWERFHGIDRISAGAAASYRHKFGLGYAVPWLSLALSGAHDDYHGGIRDSNRYEASAELGQRFSEGFDASVGAVYDRRDARSDEPVVPGISGRVFDVRGRRAFVRAGYALNEQLHIGGSFALRRGDVVSTTRQNLDIFLASDAIAADPSFGGEFFAYRLRGTTRTATVTSSWALSDRSSLNLRYADERTRAYDGLDYRGYIAELSLLFSY